MAVQHWSEKDVRDAELRAMLKSLTNDELRAILWEIMQRLVGRAPYKG